MESTQAKAGGGDVACSDWHGVQPRTMTAVFHFVQEVQQTKVHWVSGGGGVRRGLNTHTITHMLSSCCSGGTTFAWRTLQVTVSS